MDLILIILLLLIGLIFIFLEIILLPGLIVGILGGTLLISSILLAFELNGIYGIITLSTAILFLIFLLWIVQKFKLKDKLVLNESHSNGLNISHKSEKEKLINQIGITLTELKPTGLIMVNNHKYEARSEGVYIPRNQKIKITSIESSQIIVKNMEKES